MVRKILFFLVLVATSLFATFSYAELGEFADSICRINAGTKKGNSSYGTGFVYKEDKDSYYILSAGHLIGIADGATVSLYHGGEEWVVNAEVVFYTIHGRQSETGVDVLNLINNGDKMFCNDVAVLKIDKHQIFKANWPPMKVVPMILNYKATKNTFSWTYGCPDGKWPSAVKGRLLGRYGELLRFQPAPIPGRSGSPLFDHYCEGVVGIVTMCTDVGHASNIDAVYQILKERGLEPNVDNNSNRGPGSTKT